MQKINSPFVAFVNKNLNALALSLAIITAIYIRLHAIDFISADFAVFEEWGNNIKQLGAWKALSVSMRFEYNVAFFYIFDLLSLLPLKLLHSLKILTISIDFISALLIYKILLKLLFEEPSRKYYAAGGVIAFLFAPTVFLNSSVWGQIDGLYTLFILAAFYAILLKKPKLSIIFLAIGFSLKPQAIFFAPVIVFLHLRNNFYSVKDYLLFPLVYIIFWIPALIAGRSIVDVALIFPRQMGFFKQLTVTLPNFYSLFPSTDVWDLLTEKFIPSEMYYILSPYATLLTLSVFLIFLLFLTAKNYTLSTRNITLISLWCLTIAPFLLPMMHERYMYSGDVFSILFYAHIRKYLFIPIGINTISLISYFPFLFGRESFPPGIIGLIFLLVICTLTMIVIKELEAESLSKNDREII